MVPLRAMGWGGFLYKCDKSVICVVIKLICYLHVFNESITFCIKCLKMRLTCFFQLYKGQHQDSPCMPHGHLCIAADGEKDPSQSPLSLGPPLPMTTLTTTEGQEVMPTTMMMDTLNRFLDTRMTGCLSP